MKWARGCRWRSWHAGGRWDGCGAGAAGADEVAGLRGGAGRGEAPGEPAGRHQEDEVARRQPADERRLPAELAVLGEHPRLLRPDQPGRHGRAADRLPEAARHGPVRVVLPGHHGPDGARPGREDRVGDLPALGQPAGPELLRLAPHVPVLLRARAALGRERRHAAPAVLGLHRSHPARRCRRRSGRRAPSPRTRSGPRA